MNKSEKFFENPTDQSSYSVSYLKSFLSLPASPEYAIGEVCLASLIRALGSRVKEGEVYSINSRKKSDLREHFENQWTVFLDKFGFEMDLINLMKSPLSNQSVKKPLEYLNMYPYIPQFTYVSNSARFNGNPWNPSEFIKGMIATGSKNIEDAKKVWSQLYDILSVSEDDDLWARVLNNVFNNVGKVDKKFHWELNEYDSEMYDYYSIPNDIFEKNQFPAKTFCEKIPILTELKTITTRRQWISIFESILRVTISAHLVWICQININLWDLVRSRKSMNRDCFLDEYHKIFTNFKFLELDSTSDVSLRNICGKYAEARIGLNLAIHFFESYHNVMTPTSFNNSVLVVDWVIDVREKLNNNQVRSSFINRLLELLQKNPKLQTGDGSFSKNLFEFLRHTLGQKVTTEPHERNFDQSYWIFKSGEARKKPWIVKLGPVSVISIVALAISGKSGVASDLTDFLKSIGIVINPDKLLESSLGSDLARYGLTMDSPDGEKGIIIMNPFQI